MNIKIKILHDQFCQEALIVRNFRPSTIKWYKTSLKQFLNFYDDEIKNIDQICTEKLRQYLYHKRIHNHWSAETFLNQYKGIKSFLKWCVKNNHLVSNPIEPIEKPKLEKKLPKRVTKQEAVRILEYAFNRKTSYRFQRYRDRAILAIMIFAGLRAQEALTLKRGHLDLQNRLLIFI